MKIWILTFILCFFYLRVTSQTLTQQEKQQYIDRLDSVDENARFQALRDILENEISEALPKIENNFWKENVNLQLLSLMAMEVFQSQNLYTFARAFIDSSESIANNPITLQTALELKVEGTYYLHRTGDYSTTNYIFEHLRRGRKASSGNAQKILKSIVQHIPEYADSAKEELLRIKHEDPFWYSRVRALDDLVELYDQEMFPEIVDMFVNDSMHIGSPRIHALKMLFKMNYPNLRDLLKDRLSKEVAPAYRGLIADSLLKHYGSITDYVFVKNYLPQETDPKIKSWIERSIRDYEPPKPGKTYTIIQMLDSLAYCLQQVAGYGWIGDADFITEVNNYLETAKNKAVINDSINCTRYIWTFKQKINEEYIDSLDNDIKFVTIDGWKFLYYNAQYILDRLPQIPAESAADMLDTLSSRLQMSYASNWIGNHTFVQILEKNLQNAKSKYTAKDSIGCAQEIESFYKLVRLKYIAQGTQFVKAEAYNLLYNYAREITSKVIVLPLKSNATLIDKITALKTQIRTDASVKLIGGELLLRGLESSLEIAKQRLQKSDSASTALYVTLFQQTVRQTYEITKRYPASRIYVKAGGYISLYYRAEYILEYLTVPIGQPMPKMAKELEEELGKYWEISR